MKAHRQLVRVLCLCLGAALLMVLVAVGFAHASEDNAGTTAANYLSIGAGPRVLSMGGATLGMGADLGAASWNPASLGWMDQGAVMLSHSGLDNSSYQEWAALGGRLGSRGTRWALSGLYQGDGSFDGRDASNNSTGGFSVTSFAAGAQLAQRLGSHVTIGFGLKTVVEDLAGVSGIGTTFDGGLQYQQGIVSLGAAFQNVGGHMSYSGAVYPFPTNYGVGFAIAHPASGLSLAVDANFPYAYANDVRAGAEWRWRDMLALRAGYRHEMASAAGDDPLSGPTFGLGAGTKAYWIDYGYLISGNQEGQHRIALTFFPGRWAGLGSDPYGQGDIPSDFGSSEPKKNTPLIGPPIPKDLKKKGK